jgi:membrane glycosyltransferase
MENQEEYDKDFIGAISELEANEEIELVDHNELFGKIDSNKIFKVFEETEKRSKISNNSQNYTNKKNGLINEDYLRSLINSEVNAVVSDAIDTIVENITYQVEKAISIAMMHASNSKEKTETNEQQQ